MNTIKEIIRTIAVVAVLAASVSLVSAWTAPTQTPPAGNVAAPVNVGALSQIKSGPLQVNGFRNIGNSIFDGSVGIGTVAPTQKLDVNGDIKTNAGIWLGGVRKTAWPSAGVISCDWSGWRTSSGTNNGDYYLTQGLCINFFCDGTKITQAIATTCNDAYGQIP